MVLRRETKNPKTYLGVRAAPGMASVSSDEVGLAEMLKIPTTHKERSWGILAVGLTGIPVRRSSAGRNVGGEPVFHFLGRVQDEGVRW